MAAVKPNFLAYNYFNIRDKKKKRAMNIVSLEKSL